MVNTVKFESFKNAIHTPKEFLSLCSAKEKKIITRVSADITYDTFLRLTYLTDFFSCNDFNTHLWNTYCKLFTKEINQEPEEEMDKNKITNYLLLHEKLVTEFLERQKTGRI